MGYQWVVTGRLLVDEKLMNRGLFLLGRLRRSMSRRLHRYVIRLPLPNKYCVVQIIDDFHSSYRNIAFDTPKQIMEDAKH